MLSTRDVAKNRCKIDFKWSGADKISNFQAQMLGLFMSRPKSNSLMKSLIAVHNDGLVRLKSERAELDLF